MVNAPKIQMQYSSFLQDLQGDFDEDKFNENTDINVELLGLEDLAYFETFESKLSVKYAESKICFLKIT